MTPLLKEFRFLGILILMTLATSGCMKRTISDTLVFDQVKTTEADAKAFRDLIFDSLVKDGFMETPEPGGFLAVDKTPGVSVRWFKGRHDTSPEFYLRLTETTLPGLGSELVGDLVYDWAGESHYLKRMDEKVNGYRERLLEKLGLNKMQVFY